MADFELCADGVIVEFRPFFRSIRGSNPGTGNELSDEQDQAYLHGGRKFERRDKCAGDPTMHIAAQRT
jgi:hypothetical protein